MIRDAFIYMYLYNFEGAVNMLMKMILIIFNGFN